MEKIRVREPFAATSMRFYPAEESSCRDLLERCLHEAEIDELESESAHPGIPDDMARKEIRTASQADSAEPKRSERAEVHSVAGIVPHAGWIFSGATAARVFRRFLSNPPETFILFGADHRGAVRCGGVDYVADHKGVWRTPVGTVAQDHSLAEHLLSTIPGLLEATPESHLREHSIEVQVPFIHCLFPEAKICPILVPPFTGAALLGRAVFRALEGWPNRVVAIGSTDLTHYGPAFGFTPAQPHLDPHSWAKNVNDRAMIHAIVDLAADDVLGICSTRRNACGPGAIAAAVGFASEAGVRRGRLLQHITSSEVMPQANREDFVGYAAIVFERDESRGRGSHE